MTNLPALPDMTRDHPKRFVAALNMLAAANHTTIDDANHEAYFEVLGSLPIGAVETTCGTMARRNSAFMPTAGEVFTHADALAAQDWQATMDAQPALPAPDEWTAERARGSENRLTFLKALVPFLGIDRVKKLAPTSNSSPNATTVRCAGTWAGSPRWMPRAWSGGANASATATIPR